jgi:lysophospholipase L1-like esterase
MKEPTLSKNIICVFFLLLSSFYCKSPNQDKINKKTVFMGDSITEMWVQYSDFFELNKSFINKGISGQTTPQMLERFENDVIKENTNTVVILAGINDIAQNTGPISIEEIANNIIKMSELALNNNINVFICSVLPAKKFIWNKSINPTYKVISLNKLLKKYCKERSVNYINYYSSMVDWGGGLKAPEYTSIWDLVHPNNKGYKIMEEILLENIKKEL